jgi:TPP-dependent indolepyruvate ferredoxin oxidoreductase alpha subunit
MNEKSDQDLERQLSEMLTDGEMEKKDREKEERRLLSPKYEIRIQTQLDPIVEETQKYRSMAKELDDRYDKYMDKVVKKDKPEDSGEEA